MRSHLVFTSLAAGVVAVALGTPASAQSASEKTFVREAAMGDLGEIALGKLAAEKAASPNVKAFGQTLATDHQAALDDMTQLATALKEKVPTEPKPEARKEEARLSKLSGAEFDRAFVKLMVDDHRKDVKEFEQHAKGNDDVAKVASKQLPVLQKHLQTAESLQTKS